MQRRFFLFVLASMVLGIVAGLIFNQVLPAEQVQPLASNLGIVTDLFLRMIKMIIAPLVFSTLVSGIAHMEDAASVGRVGVKTMGWFITASLLSLTIGLIMVHLLQPGAGLDLDVPVATSSEVDVSQFTLRTFVTQLVPASFVEAMAKNEILQIVIFSLFVGTAVAALDDKVPAVLALVDQITAILL
jgi:Na+/H+-dicarboxylate symporter